MRILHCTNRFKDPIFKSSTANEGKQPSGRQRRWSAAPKCGKDPGESSMEFGAAHSSSQRPSDTIGNTPPPSCQSPSMALAGPPPPAGVILFSLPISFILLGRSACTMFVQIWPPLCGAMQLAHRCHEAFDLPKPGSLDYLQLIDRGGALLLPAPLDLDRQHSSSQLPIRTKRRSLDLLPQRALFDSSQPFRSAVSDSAFAIRRRKQHLPPECRHKEACKSCMGAMQHYLCKFRPNRLYFGTSDDGQQRDKRWQTTLERIGS